MEIEASNNDNAYWPTISNITLKRAAGTVTEGGSSAAEYDAIQFKKHGNGDFSNIVISGYTSSGATAVRIQDANTNTFQVNTNKIKLSSIKINDGTTQYAGVGTLTISFPTGQYTLNNNATGATLTAGVWTTVNGSNLLQ